MPRGLGGAALWAMAADARPAARRPSVRVRVARSIAARGAEAGRSVHGPRGLPTPQGQRVGADEPSGGGPGWQAREGARAGGPWWGRRRSRSCQPSDPPRSVIPSRSMPGPRSADAEGGPLARVWRGAPCRGLTPTRHAPLTVEVSQPPSVRGVIGGHDEAVLDQRGPCVEPGQFGRPEKLGPPFAGEEGVEIHRRRHLPG